MHTASSASIAYNLFLLIYLSQPFGSWSYFWLVFCSLVAFIGPAFYIQGHPDLSICICTYICNCTHICICRYICICIYVCIYTYICICTCIFGLYFLAGGMHRANIIQSRTTQFGKVFVFSADSMWATLVTNSKIKSSPHRNIIPSDFFGGNPLKSTLSILNTCAKIY